MSHPSRLRHTSVSWGVSEVSAVSDCTVRIDFWKWNYHRIDTFKYVSHSGSHFTKWCTIVLVFLLQYLKFNKAHIYLEFKMIYTRAKVTFHHAPTAQWTMTVIDHEHSWWWFVVVCLCQLRSEFKGQRIIAFSRSTVSHLFMHLSIASPAPGDPGHGGDHAGTVRERTKNVAGYAGACSGDVQNVARGGRGV